MINETEWNVEQQVKQIHENIKLLCESDEPCIQNLAMMMLALSRQLMMAVDPFHVEFINDYE